MQIAPLWVALPQRSAGFVVTRFPCILLPLPSAVLPSRPHLRHAASLSPRPLSYSTPRNRSCVWRTVPLPFLPVPLLEGPHPSTTALSPPLGCPRGILDQRGDVEAPLLPRSPCHKDLLLGFKASIHLSCFLLLLRTPQQTSPRPACSAPRASLHNAFSLPCYQDSGRENQKAEKEPFRSCQGAQAANLPHVGASIHLSQQHHLQPSLLPWALPLTCRQVSSKPPRKVWHRLLCPSWCDTAPTPPLPPPALSSTGLPQARPQPPLCQHWIFLGAAGAPPAAPSPPGAGTARRQQAPIQPHCTALIFCKRHFYLSPLCKPPNSLCAELQEQDSLSPAAGLPLPSSSVPPR